MFTIQDSDRKCYDETLRMCIIIDTMTATQVANDPGSESPIFSKDRPCDLYFDCMQAFVGTLVKT